MTTIYFDPDESHRFTSIEAESCPGLEALTGADFIISDLPIDPVESIGWHVENGSMFVQVKSGYDFVLNHEQRHKFAARTQALGISASRRCYLGIGDYSEDKDGNLRCGYYKPLQKVTWQAYEHMLDDAMNRGLFWRTIKSESELPAFIERVARLMEQPRELKIYTRQAYNWDTGEFWQQVEEIDQESVQHILACGLPGFGPKRASAVVEYLTRNKYPVCLYTALAVLCQIDEKGKRVHKIPSIGAEYWKRARDWVFRCQTVDGKEDDNKVVGGLNLCLHSTDNEQEFWRGARSSLARFHEAFEVELKATTNGQPRPAKIAYNNAMQETLKLVNEFYRVRQLPGEDFPF